MLCVSTRPAPAARRFAMPAAAAAAALGDVHLGGKSSPGGHGPVPPGMQLWAIKAVLSHLGDKRIFFFLSDAVSFRVGHLPHSGVIVNSGTL